MNNDTIAGVDLAKDVIQVCAYSIQKVRSNTDMTTPNFLERLANNNLVRGRQDGKLLETKPFEFGHSGQLISAKRCSPTIFVEKFDKNAYITIIY